MKKHVIAGWIILFAVTARSPLAIAGIVYDAATNTIAVRNFPAEWPCTSERLGAMDRLCGWNKVFYDSANHTWTIRANLEIGANDGSNTYFQIGGPDCPRETLIVYGNVTVYPYWIEGENPGLWYTASRAINRLTIGSENDQNVVATLKIASEANARHTLTVGAGGFGGQLLVFGGAITAATPDAAHRLAYANNPKLGMILRGDEIIFKNATISWIDGLMCYGAQEFRATDQLHVKFQCENTVFEHGGVALSGNGVIRGCTFQYLDCAIQDQGALNLVLTDCVFRNNRRDWNLSYTPKGVIAVDCEIVPGERPDVYRAYAPPNGQGTNQPRFESYRHVVVEALDTNRKPIANAWVIARPANHVGEVENEKTRTDKTGRTPGRGQGAAIRLLDMSIRAGATNKPTTIDSGVYSIVVSAPGYRSAELQPFRPTKSWQVIAITLAHITDASVK